MKQLNVLPGLTANDVTYGALVNAENSRDSLLRNAAPGKDSNFGDCRIGKFALAVLLALSGLNADSMRVALVFAATAPFKIAHGVIKFVSVNMINLLFWMWGSVKCRRYHSSYAAQPSASILEQYHRAISKMTDLCLLYEADVGAGRISTAPNFAI